MIPVEQPAAGGDTQPKRSRVKRVLVEIAVLLLVAAVGGMLVAASGIVPIKASSGHWPITAWFLNFSMGRSVATHTIGDGERSQALRPSSSAPRDKQRVTVSPSALARVTNFHWAIARSMPTASAMTENPTTTHIEPPPWFMSSQID